MKNIMPIFRKSTKQIAKELDEIASKHGKLCWLFLPETLENKVCLVAHIDTVWDEGDSGQAKHKQWHKITKEQKEIFYDYKQRVIWSPSGLGADDRAGIYACLEAFSNIPEPYKPIVLLTNCEETGGDGAFEAIDEFEELLADNVSFFVELDRRGCGEAVFYNNEGKEFIDYVESFGFEEHFGTFSDVSIICDFLGICGVNLSIGYYNEHTKYEYLNLNDMEYTTKKIFDILKDNFEKSRVWDLPPITERNKDGYEEDDRYFNYWEDDLCPWCHEYVTERDIEMNFCTNCGCEIRKETHAASKHMDCL